MSAWCTVSCLAVWLAAAPPAQINPYPRTELSQVTLAEWRLNNSDDGWKAEHECTLSAADGVLTVRSAGSDPYFHHPLDLPGGRLILKLAVRARTAGPGQIFWTTDKSPRRDEDKQVSFPIRHDGQWHDCTVTFTVDGRLRDLRIDPGTAAGEVEIKSLRLVRAELHPLEITRVETTDDRARAEVTNHAATPLTFQCAGKSYTIAGGTAVEIEQPLAKRRPLEPVTFELTTAALPPVRRTVFALHPDVQADWIDLSAPGDGGEKADAATPAAPIRVRIAPDGSVARIERGGQLVGWLGPLVHFDGRLPALKLRRSGSVVLFLGEGVDGSVSLDGEEISVGIGSELPCEGPVVRAVGPMQQAVFTGVEYLENGEASSSTLDIETPEHVRFAPDPMKLTMPLMAVVTDRASLTLVGDRSGGWEGWKGTYSPVIISLGNASATISAGRRDGPPESRPVFATPNFFDGTADHRMAVRGRTIDATIHVGPRQPIEEEIVRAVHRLGLPQQSPGLLAAMASRTANEQKKLCLAALNGPLRTKDGWGHCAEAHWKRQPFADIASAYWRMSGEVPQLPRLVPGGSHVRNDAICFVSGRAQEWLDLHRRRAAELIRQQQPDGSYHYDGPLRRGHFEDTASGVCARPAVELLEFAYDTGDEAARTAGLKTLDYLRRFRTPRGAQVWEVPLHTPDQLASAYAVWANVRGYELTGRKEYLAEARRWAISGLPFVYMWSCQPVMLYATTPVFGATQWKAPNWIGLPVQWVGGVYAYSLTMLAPYDATLDWRQLARGILIAAEQMQYPDGPNQGLLPDSFDLPTQQRRPWNINPAAIWSLRLVLDGQLDALSLAKSERHRVLAPFPAEIRDGKAHIRAQKDVRYQVLIDGRRVVDVTSLGADVLELE